MFTNYETHGSPLMSTPSILRRVQFNLINTNTTIANTLRRCILMDTRSVSFRADLTNASDPGVVIRKNTSVIFNEMLAHRMTLLPLGIVNIDSVNLENYECVLQVKNEVSGPITAGAIRNVTASDFVVREKKPDGSVIELPAAASTTMFPVNPLTRESSLLLTLRPQWNPAQPAEEIDLTAYPVVGRGRDFMGFCPVSQCSFQNTLDPDPVRQEAFFKEWVQTYKKTADPGALTPEQREAFHGEWSTMAKQRCFKVGADGQPNEFTFTVESVGIRPPNDIIAEGIQAAIDLVTPYTSEEDQPTSAQPVDGRIDGVNLVFEGQDHTLGNLLQTIISELYLDKGAAESPITFVGYKVRHPLAHTMNIVFGVREGVAGDHAVLARKIVAEAAKKAQELFEGMKRSWEGLHTAA